MEVDPIFAAYLFFIKLYPKSTLTFFPVCLTLRDGASGGPRREKPAPACVLVVGLRHAAGTKPLQFQMLRTPEGHVLLTPHAPCGLPGSLIITAT